MLYSSVDNLPHQGIPNFIPMKTNSNQFKKSHADTSSVTLRTNLSPLIQEKKNSPTVEKSNTTHFALIFSNNYVNSSISPNMSPSSIFTCYNQISIQTNDENIHRRDKRHLQNAP